MAIQWTEEAAAFATETAYVEAYHVLYGRREWPHGASVVLRTDGTVGVTTSGSEHGWEAILLDAGQIAELAEANQRGANIGEDGFIEIGFQMFGTLSTCAV